MKKAGFLFLMVLLLSCDDSEPKSQEEVRAKISKIERSISPTLQIEGEEIPVYTIEDRLKELGIPGVSVAVAFEGEIIWAKGYGMADVSENRGVDSVTMFLAGSISKPVAALRAHQMVEAGTLSLDGNVNEYLTSWQVPDNEFTVTEKVTLRRILNHTAGLTVWGFPGYDKGDTVPTVVEVLDGVGNTDPVRVYKVPGESWMYSGGGYTIMQLMISDVEKQPFEETLKKNVLDPLGMGESTFANPLSEKYHAIAATGYRANGDEVEGKWPIYPEMAAAGLWTTPSQLIQYATEIQEIHQTKQEGILKYETVEEMLTPGMNNHGLGPGVSEFTFGHGGADEGFRADLTAWKDKPYAIVVMVNSDNGTIMQEIKLAFAREFNLPGFAADVRKITEIPDEKLDRFTGGYIVEELGSVEIFKEYGELRIVAGFIDDTLKLKAESDTIFFDKNDGTRFTFHMKDDLITGFGVQRFQAVKQD